jgi:hypothetical protein
MLSLVPVQEVQKIEQTKISGCVTIQNICERFFLVFRRLLFYKFSFAVFLNVRRKRVNFTGMMKVAGNHQF